ncbi:hypothetical protein C2G38_2156252 [Gigaspora rosea]|uniref:Zn(2)-C6 fungal-type domain-containing protein n=1 Tax=Gigaspora rosea TaxID=44941 RepID=A0A397W4C4_9GLOM|nr:hypothetical protein C2G38_2156252 [Gigaspora rosea]
MSSLKIKKTSSLKTRCFSCRKQQIKCKPSIENPNICQYCFKKNYNENKCLKTSPKYYPDEIKRLNSIVIENKLRISDLEKRFYSALLLIKNKPTPIPQSKNNDRTNDTTTTYTETASTTTLLTTIKPDFDFPKRLKDLLTSKESTTNSTTTRTFQKSFIKRFYI